MNLSTYLVSNEKLNIKLQEILFEELSKAVASVKKGHRLQVTDIPMELMGPLCIRMNKELKNVRCYVLASAPKMEYEITSTKLIMERNEFEETLLVFIPNDIRTAAEDSFDVSTFKRYQTHEVYRKTYESLMKQLKPDEAGLVKEILRIARSKDMVKICKFLMAIQEHNGDNNCIGLSFANIDLVPDKDIYPGVSDILPRISMNKDCVEKLSNLKSTQIDRFNSLELLEDVTSTLLLGFIKEEVDPTPSIWLNNLIMDEHAEEMTFDRWRFSSKSGDKIEEMEIISIGIEDRTEDDYQILNLLVQDSIKVKWETIPAPISVEDLDYFTVEVVQDELIFANSKRIKKGPVLQKQEALLSLSWQI